MIKCELCGKETDKFHLYRTSKGKKQKKTTTKRFCPNCYVKTGQKRGKAIIALESIDGRDGSSKI